MTLDLAAIEERAKQVRARQVRYGAEEELSRYVLALAEEVRRLEKYTQEATSLVVVYRREREHNLSDDICQCSGCKAFYAWLEAQATTREPDGEAK